MRFPLRNLRERFRWWLRYGDGAMTLLVISAAVIAIEGAIGLLLFILVK